MYLSASLARIDNVVLVERRLGIGSWRVHVGVGCAVKRGGGADGRRREAKSGCRADCGQGRW